MFDVLKDSGSPTQTDTSGNIPAPLPTFLFRRIPGTKNCRDSHWQRLIIANNALSYAVNARAATIWPGPGDLPGPFISNLSRGKVEKRTDTSRPKRARRRGGPDKSCAEKPQTCIRPVPKRVNAGKNHANGRQALPRNGNFPAELLDTPTNASCLVWSFDQSLEITTNSFYDPACLSDRIVREITVRCLLSLLACWGEAGEGQFKSTTVFSRTTLATKLNDTNP